MPNTYSGNAGAITPRSAVTITEPIDSDARNAASVTLPLEQLANLCQYLMQRAVLNGNAPADNLNTGRIQFKPSAVTEPLFELLTAPANNGYQLLFQAPTNAGGTSFVRAYAHSYPAGAPGGLVITQNAAWNGTAWVADAALRCSQWSLVDMGYMTMRQYLASSPGEVIAFSETIRWDYNGHQYMNAQATPAYATAFNSVLTKHNVPKAWALLRLGTSPAIIAGFNVSGFAKGVSNNGVIDWAQDFAGTDYCVIGNADWYADGGARFVPYSRTAGQTQFVITDNASDGGKDVWTSAYSSRHVSILAFGQQ